MFFLLPIIDLVSAPRNGHIWTVLIEYTPSPVSSPIIVQDKLDWLMIVLYHILHSMYSYLSQLYKWITLWLYKWITLWLHKWITFLAKIINVPSTKIVMCFLVATELEGRSLLKALPLTHTMGSTLYLFFILQKTQLKSRKPGNALETKCLFQVHKIILVIQL